MGEVAVVALESMLIGSKVEELAGIALYSMLIGSKVEELAPKAGLACTDIHQECPSSRSSTPVSQ